MIMIKNKSRPISDNILLYKDMAGNKALFEATF